MGVPVALHARPAACRSFSPKDVMGPLSLAALMTPALMLVPSMPTWIFADEVIGEFFDRADVHAAGGLDPMPGGGDDVYAGLAGNFFEQANVPAEVDGGEIGERIEAFGFRGF